MTMSQTTIFLYGPPGSGKTTIGRILAATLNLPFFDLDAEIEKRWECTIAEIFKRHGEAAFRQAEKHEIEQLLAQGGAVVALGGGSLVNPAVRALVQDSGTVLCLHAAPGALLDRLSGDTGQGDQNRQRPLLAGDVASKLADLLSQREEHYASFPLQLDTTLLAADRAAWEAQILLGRFRVGKISQPYDVCIQPGGLDFVGRMISQRGLHGPVALVTDSNTGPLYAARVIACLENMGSSPKVIVIPQGESFKTLATVQGLWEGFLDADLERSSTVIALGGGVVGDLTGFAASTYMRGIRWVNLPTTLLAMVDSSLGGKTAVDISRGKNLIGAFHPPAFVLADPDVLSTLPEVEFRSGMAEAIKHGIIGDPGLIEKCSVFKSEIGEIVSRAMAVKIRIIEDDPYEKGVRAVLNLGHTVGHALELVSGYRLRHGEAVAIGMVVEARLAEHLKLAEQGLSLHIASFLAGMGLPVAIPGDLDRAAIRRVIGVDKKKARGRVRFALPVRIGQVQFGIDVPDDVLAVEI
jgi:shikimate kinase/3-dehydroquinate synthase